MQTYKRDDEDFISMTIRQVDTYLQGEREAEEARARRELEHDPEYQQWCREISEENDREWERYWSEHCPEHGTELHDNGLCMICVQEERRNDA